MENNIFSSAIPVTKSQGGKDIINARDLHRELAVGRDFSTWIKGRIEKYGFVENVDFCTFPKMGEPDNQTVTKGMRVAIEYAITLDMAKGLCMIENNEMGHRLRQYFIECEKKLREIMQQKNTLKLPPTYKDLLILYKDTIDNYLVTLDEKEKLEIENKQQNLMIQNQATKIEEDKPKVEFANQLLASSTSISVHELATLISNNSDFKIGEKGLFQWLRDNGYISKRTDGRMNEPLHQWVKIGLLEGKASYYRNNDGMEIMRIVPRVTPKGVQYFIQKFKKMVYLD